jgi:cell fate (sporulation/competence/biofilm development) regulator YlbF (YheA/YmcA/DUF963 family)
MELAQKLGEAILNSDEYKNFNSAQEEMNNDTEACNLVDAFQELQQGLRDDQMLGRKISQEQIDELRSHQKQMMENSAINSYLEAKRTLDNLMSSVHQAIGSVVGISPAGGSGGCSGGCC